MKIFNLHGDDWDRVEDREGWRSKDAWIGARIGAELIGGSMYELEAGDRLWPYHTRPDGLWLAQAVGSACGDVFFLWEGAPGRRAFVLPVLRRPA